MAEPNHSDGRPFPQQLISSSSSAARAASSYEDKGKRPMDFNLDDLSSSSISSSVTAAERDNKLPSFPVIINVYDVSRANRFLKHIGLGFYRLSIRVQSKEYMFTDFRRRGLDHPWAPKPSRTSAVITNIDRQYITLRRSAIVGRTMHTESEVQEEVERLIKDDFGEDSYDYTCNNSYDFVARLCCKLFQKEDAIGSSIKWPARCTSIEPAFKFLTKTVLESTSGTTEVPVNYPVILHCYRKVPRKCGFNFYISSIEVHGHEYAFTEYTGPPAIGRELMIGVSNRVQRIRGELFGDHPGLTDLVRVGSFVMGWTKLKTNAEVTQVVRRIEEGGGFIRDENNFYHYFDKNSHHFTDALSFELCGVHIPRWLWRGAYAERWLTGEALTGHERQMRTEERRRTEEEWAEQERRTEEERAEQERRTVEERAEPERRTEEERAEEEQRTEEERVEQERRRASRLQTLISEERKAEQEAL